MRPRRSPRPQPPCTIPPSILLCHSRAISVLGAILTMLDYGWQYDPALWAEIPTDLRDSQSWRSVEFVENESVSVPRQRSGIYLFCTTPAGCRRQPPIPKNALLSNLVTPIYIGQTEDLQQRFIRHCRYPSHKLDSARACFGVSLQFWFHRLPVYRLRHDEAVLIRCFGPTANDRKESIIGIARNPIPIGIPK